MMRSLHQRHGFVLCPGGLTDSCGTQEVHRTLFIRGGDTCEVEISEIGQLRNLVETA